ncbi:MAG: PAS domain S-box protein [Myxococcales bacterium]|nr:PAS domain S-box protein [Myxococcales bacterium]
MSVGEVFEALLASESLLALLVDATGMTIRENCAWARAFPAQTAVGLRFPDEIDAILASTVAAEEVRWERVSDGMGASVVIAPPPPMSDVGPLLEAWPEHVAVYALDGHWLAGKSASWAASGRTSHRLKLWEVPWIAARPAFADAARAAFARATAGEASSFDEGGPMSAAPEIEPVRVHMSPVVRGGRVVAVAGFVTSGAAEARALTKLRQSEESLHEAQRIARLGSWAERADSTLVVSPELCRLLELDPATEMDLDDAFARVQPEDQALVRECLGPCPTGATTEALVRVPRPGGVTRWLRLRCAHAEGGKRSGTVQDVSHRVAARQELQTHSLVLSSLSEGVLFIDETYAIRFANPALERTFGYAAGELLGRPVGSLNALTNEGNAALREAILAGLARQGSWSGTLASRRKDGTVFTSRAHVTRLETPGGPVFVSVLRDITDEERATAALRENARLEAEATYRKELLDEFHHRVKNNLQTIASMLRVHFGSLRDPATQALLAAALHRIEAVALVHEKLSEAEVDGDLDMLSYLGQLAKLVAEVHGTATQLAVRVSSEPLGLPSERYLDLGLLLSELITNAFPPRPPRARRLRDRGARHGRRRRAPRRG